VRRADVVATALQQRGIPASIITKDGKGESALAKATADGVREPLNRRSEVTIIVQ
jgi:outer membrane protein OmpA-like peptidoglycan-associated protein